MSQTRLRNIKIFGWIAAIATSLVQFISGDVVGAIGIVAAATTSASIPNESDD